MISPLRYVLDENTRGRLWDAIRRDNAGGFHTIDVVRVGDEPDLPLGTLDPVLLVWAAREDRIVVTRDKSTMPVHLKNHLQAGYRSPGILIVRSRSSLAAIREFLIYAASEGEPFEFEDRITYIP